MREDDTSGKLQTKDKSPELNLHRDCGSERLSSLSHLENGQRGMQQAAPREFHPVAEGMWSSFEKTEFGAGSQFRIKLNRFRILITEGDITSLRAGLCGLELPLSAGTDGVSLRGLADDDLWRNLLLI